jgi:carboxyl-terminal processing protease
MNGYRTGIAAGVFGAALVAGGALMERGLTPARDRAAGERLFERLVEIVQRNYIEPVPTDSLFRSAIDGMLRELGDPHTSYLPPRRLERLNESTTGNYGGIGVEIDIRDAGIAVVAPLPGSPAAEAGLTTGDLIIEVNRTSTRGWTIEEARSELRGAPGTKVSIAVARSGVPEPLPFELTRSEVHRQAVRRAVILRDGIGYVDVDVFSTEIAAELESAIERVRSEGARSLILDLRSNPGGLLDQGVKVTDLFLDPGQRIVEMRGRVPQANQTYADRAPQRWRSMPIVILVDGGSASASEIVAGALQDHDRAAIVGERTFGKGSAQSLVGLPGGNGALKVTTALWFTPLGRTINRAPGERAEDSLDLFAPVPEGKGPPTFTTAGGRTVYGGGGIVPDVGVARVASPDVELAFRRGLGRNQRRYNDALTEHAIAMRGARSIRSPDFTVTAAMLDDLWGRMQRRGIEVDRAVYDRASPLVSRQLGNEIARYVFGPDAEFLRNSYNDDAIVTAIELAAGATNQDEVFARAGSRGRPAIVGTRSPQ